MRAVDQHNARNAAAIAIAQLQCRHAHVTSDGRCLHCNADCSPQLTAAADALNAEIARTLASGPHSPSTAHPNTGRGVGIATLPARAPRHGGLAFFATTSSHGGV